MTSKLWVYLSPHLDDAALSCGGLIWEQAQAGAAVSVWTVCAGDPPAGALSAFAEELHERWQTGREAVQLRRDEDRAACAHMQAAWRHLPIPDGIYRRAGEEYLRQSTAGQAPESRAQRVENTTGEAAVPLRPYDQRPYNQGGERPHVYPTWEEMIDLQRPPEADLAARLSEFLRHELPAAARVVCPLALGEHVDHRLVRAAAEKLGRRLLYYADYPYVMRESNLEKLQALQEAGWKKRLTPISPDGFAAWLQAIAAHQSQISSFWADQVTMEVEMRQYMETMGGGALWSK